VRSFCRRFLTALVLLATQLPAASAADLAFVRRTFYDAPYTAALYDFNGNGYPSLLGTFQRGGQLRSIPPGRLGLAAIFALPEDPSALGLMRLSRDTRAADLDNDGRPDLVNNVYSCNGDPLNSTQLYLRKSDGTFARSQALDLFPPIRGRGETIVAADFDNDGYLDLYIPQYTRPDSSIDNFGECLPFLPNDAPARSWLLLNQGTVSPGNFVAKDPTPVDLTTQDCGADCANSGDVTDRYSQPEGAQAIDYDDDGNVDLFVGGMLFRNLGAADFDRVWPSRGTTPAFDEGAKFLDWNNDGYPDLVTLDPYWGLRLYSWTGGARDSNDKITDGALTQVTESAIVRAFADGAVPGMYGMTTGDVNGDGYEDIIVNGSVLDYTPKIYLNQGPPTYAFKRATISGFANVRAGRNGPVLGDLNNDGMPEILMTGQFGNASTHAYYNVTRRPATQTLTVEVLGVVSGRTVRNQQGRAVHVVPQSAPAGFSYTRYVDGGSGYMAQGPYPVSIATPFTGPHTISVRFASGTVSCVATPPAYVLIWDRGLPVCVSLPLPQPAPIPEPHNVRALQGPVQMLLD
jgi:hypothetical protein